MAISNDIVRHVARLARIRLNDDEVGQTADQFAEIIEYFDSIKRFVLPDAVAGDADGAPVSSTRERSDEVDSGRGLDHHGMEGTRFQDGFFVVPRVVE